MKGIKMSDCRFYVNEKERTVVCVIPDTDHMVLDYIWENFQWHDINMYDALEKRYALLMPRSFMGKAVCAAEDEWNEETGRLIAFSRAKDKCYKSFFRRANSFVQQLDKRLGDMIDSFNDFGLKLEDKREGMQQHIEELITPTTKAE